MNIDLLIGKNGQSGLLCSRAFKSVPIGAIFDAQMRAIILEFEGDNDPFHLNITVEERFCEKLLADHAIHAAFLDGDMIGESIEMPLMYLNDPYGGRFDSAPLVKTRRAVTAMEQFLRRCSFAQPIHRDDLGDESTLSGILGGRDVRTLAFAPVLLRAREMEAVHAYQAAPAMGLGLGGGTGTIRARTGTGGDTHGDY